MKTTHALLSVALLLVGTAQAADISFERDIRPILSDNCFRCHGPDDNARKAGLRLDLHDQATAEIKGVRAVVPGQPDASELVHRIESSNPDELMPPVSSGKQLTPEQKHLLRAWIAQGAPWSAHWAFVPPQRPALPATPISDWVRNPIDAFVLARLGKEGLQPSPEADHTTLLRRLALDLTGIPPTPAELDYLSGLDFEAAYDKMVDQLLDSPHYGERFARDWLDAAQYADSDGFEKDKPRKVWAWRDYVIQSFNRNLPYDLFIREQIAGDLLPHATQDQIVATGFLRNSMINEEGGIDPEQFRMEAMFNRMDVIGRAVLGLTLQCAQCHSHKYDPITHTDYYRLFAYLNNSAEACMTVYTPTEQGKRADVHAKIAAADEALKAAHPDWTEKEKAWEDSVRATAQPEWHNLELTFDDTSAGGQKCLPVGDGSYLAQGYAPTRFGPKSWAPSPVRTITAIRLELLTDPSLPRGGPGRSIYGTCALSDFTLRMAPADQDFETFDKWQKIDIETALADANPAEQPLGPEYPNKNKPDTVPEKEQDKDKRTTGPIAFALDGNHETAWTSDIGFGRSNESRYIIFKLAKPLEVPEGSKLGLQPWQNHGGWNSDNNQNNNIGRFRFSVTDATTLPEAAVPMDVLAAVQKDPAARSAEESLRVFDYWRTTVADYAAENESIEKIWKEHPRGDTQLVYSEQPTPRETYRLNRGDFLQRAERVEPGVPSFLNPAPVNAPPNRLGLAQWLTDRNAPTTARAFVNKLWQHYFGTGLVATTADFGSQGDAPTHPELLDWLAVEFMDSGWNVKHLQRLIVTSSTYRQSSRVTPTLLERDPANTLLARGARYRVDGEIVRDIALSASGLLNPRVGGPSVNPAAPAFLFVPPASYGPKPWPTATTSERYRRGLYTFRYRSVPYPMLQTFDAPPGDAPCTRRARSNTPLQALTTLNEPMFFECARALAAETLRDGGRADDSRLTYAFRRCLARAPEAEELDTLANFLRKQRTRVLAGDLDVNAILDTNGDALAIPSDEDRGELAAWTLTARLMLNLDETITRE